MALGMVRAGTVATRRRRQRPRGDKSMVYLIRKLILLIKTRRANRTRGR